MPVSWSTSKVTSPPSEKYIGHSLSAYETGADRPGCDDCAPRTAAENLAQATELN